MRRPVLVGDVLTSYLTHHQLLQVCYYRITAALSIIWLLVADCHSAIRSTRKSHTKWTLSTIRRSRKNKRTATYLIASHCIPSRFALTVQHVVVLRTKFCQGFAHAVERVRLCFCQDNARLGRLLNWH